MTAPPANGIQIVCAGCSQISKTKPTNKGQPRPPSGWKRLDEATVYCPKCWQQRYYLRAVTMNVAEPLDATWEELRTALKAMWRQTTQCANWMVTQFYARDVRRDPTLGENLPAMPKMYLYPEARELFPELPSQTVAALEQAYRGRYRAIRRDVIWTFAAALPTYHYPVPFPVHNQSWSANPDSTGERPMVNVRIADRRFLLRLKGGARFRRQLTAFNQMAKGEAIAGELAIYQRGFGKELHVKMVAWLPRQQSTESKHSTLAVRTGADCLLIAVNSKDETLWRYNGDHLRRWQAEHAAQLQRWGEDAKYENRPVPSFADRRKQASAKFRQRFDTATHQIAAALADYAQRRRFAAVRYDDKERSYCAKFPWAELRRKLAEKLDERGIQLELASGEMDDKTPGPLAENSTD